MKISILTPDLSHNCLGRAYLLAKVLQRIYEVEIVGPTLGTGIWPPVANDNTISYKSVKLHGRFKPYWEIKELSQKIDGDVIYASKPLVTSFGIGLYKKISKKKPLILDIDDWQMGFIKERYSNYSQSSYCMSFILSTFFIYRMNSYWNNLLCEKLIKFADEITVSNNFLKKKFGGTIIWHGRDTKAFAPNRKYDNYLKEKNKIKPHKKVVMFFGTPKPHKGIVDLVIAINILKNPNIILLVVGMDHDPYSTMLITLMEKKLGENFKVFGLQSFDMIPEFLSMADIVVIPQKRTLATIGQMPAKIFDAMAMQKTIITTDVSDLPEVINGCGLIVEPNNPEQLALSIQFALDNPEQAKKFAIKARQKCIEEYSWDAMEKTLLGVFSKYE